MHGKLSADGVLVVQLLLLLPTSKAAWTHKAEQEGGLVGS